MRRFVLGEFTEPDACVEAARRLREGGVQGLDAYSPYPLHGIDDALAIQRSKVPVVALTGGVLGALGGYTLQWYLNSRAYPINVGSRPQHGFWTNIPITFWFFRLPRTYHPVFESERFRTASLDAFWISAETSDENAVADLERKFREAGAHKVHTVAEAT